MIRRRIFPFQPSIHGMAGGLIVGVADLTIHVQVVVCQVGALLSFIWKDSLVLPVE